MAAWEAASPFADVGPGLTNLNMSGVKIAAMTNGARSIATNVLSRAGLSGDEVAVYDINEAKAWKPSPDAYAFACTALGLPPSEVLMVASHPWDIHGAMQAGLVGAYVQRDVNIPYPKFLDQPVFVVPDFEVLADKVLGVERGW